MSLLNTYSSTSKRSLFSASINFCNIVRSSFPKPASASFSSKVRLVIGLLQSVRSSSSLLKRLGNSPKRLFKNSSDEMGLPSALQNEVDIMCWMSRSLPSRNFTLMRFLCGPGSSSSLDRSTIGGYGFGSVWVGGSGSNGSPSHSGSAKW